ncbi:MAG TPA: hypothetical protein VK564_12245 [Thermodesulfobacteriota bacterium]|nr:hypothetical protein [Thermodesulfobacteriota bacterium]
MVGRVVLFPCGGIKKVESTIVRWAAYRVNEELLPKKTLLLCVPAYYRGVPEDLVMVEKNPTLVVDCHEESCGSFLLQQIGLLPAARFLLPELLADWGRQPGADRQALDTRGRALADRLAQEVAVIAGEMLTDPGYHFRPQQIKVPFEGQIGNWREDPAKALGYIQVRPGLYRPQAMPPLPLEGPGRGKEAET